jgi:hypothetical protein
VTRPVTAPPWRGLQGNTGWDMEATAHPRPVDEACSHGTYLRMARGDVVKWRGRARGALSEVLGHRCEDVREDVSALGAGWHIMGWNPASQPLLDARSALRRHRDMYRGGRWRKAPRHRLSRSGR